MFLSHNLLSISKQHLQTCTFPISSSPCFDQLPQIETLDNSASNCFQIGANSFGTLFGLVKFKPLVIKGRQHDQRCRTNVRRVSSTSPPLATLCKVRSDLDWHTWRGEADSYGKQNSKEPEAYMATVACAVKWPDEWTAAKEAFLE